MKKLICVFLALLMMFSAFGALAEADVMPFEATLCEVMDLSADEWMQTEYSRAMLTVLLILDLGNSDLLTQAEMEAITSTLANSNGFNYIGAVDEFIVVIIYDGNCLHMLLFIPGTNVANYTLLDAEPGSKSFSELLVQSFLDDNVTTYYKNSPDSIAEAASTLAEIMNS